MSADRMISEHDLEWRGLASTSATGHATPIKRAPVAPGPFLVSR
ncbi:MAG: hypothetical protein AAGF32_00090 [Pseudomonadota bacterium]